jgi:CheY-like chemotaxis protein
MSKTNPKIMVVEDENLLLQAISKKLTASGIEAVSCLSADQALDYLKDMDGLTFMKNLKENELWKNLPVFVVSNSASPDKVNGMLALGAKKYILKAEHRLDEIIESIKSFIMSEE